MRRVFISGSISIRKLPQAVQVVIDEFIDNGIEILVGDANGVDKLVQEYCAQNGYFNVTVYSIYNPPRNKLSSKFRFKKIPIDCLSSKEREKQQCKDRAMTRDCDCCLVVWNARSRGSYANILRALKNHKEVKVYLTSTAKTNLLDHITALSRKGYAIHILNHAFDNNTKTGPLCLLDPVF